MRDDRGYLSFDLPELDTEHDPRGGALRAWAAVLVMIAVLVL